MGNNRFVKILSILIILIIIGASVVIANDYLNTSNVEVNQTIDTNKIYFSLDEINILKGEEVKLDLKSNFAIQNDVNYLSENPEIAIVNENGIVKGISVGTTKIVVTYEKYTTSIGINVGIDYYKVTYDYSAINKKSETKKCVIKDGICNLKLKSVSNKNYILKGWTLKKGSSEIFDFNDTIPIKKDTTLYLVAEKNINSLTIKYELNGATGIGKLNDGCNAKSCEIVLPEIARNGNSDIIGWSTNSKSKEAEYKVGEKIIISKNTTLYAISRSKYIATFYNNGATSINGGSLSSWTQGSDYIQTSCFAYNKESSCIVYSPKSIEAGSKAAIGFNTSKSATTKLIGYQEKITLTKDINYYAIIALKNNNSNLTSMNSYSFSKETTVNKTKTLKVLVIEINPILNTITNTSLYKNNNGHPKVSEYFGQNADAALNEMVKDLEESSHGYLKISLKREWLNEFPTYKKTITLNNNVKANRFDESTYLSLSRKGNSDQGDWYNFITGSKLSNILSNAAYSFNYEYIVDKYDLINKRNKGEFDQVWLLSIDPTQTYETIMIGNNPYWINAPGYKANCQNFQMANISISRRDANLHALGHGVEGILRAVFHKDYVQYGDYTGTSKYYYYRSSYSSYDKDTINIASLNDYNKLNLWEKFALGTYSNKSNMASVGNIHFPFNGSSDYDYANTTKVYTNWRDWLDYPNIAGNFVLDNNNAWLTNAGNNKLDSSQNKDPDRLFTRFWFYLMPHVTGYTAEGYSNNWWDYFYSLDFVTSLSSSTQNYNIGDKVSPKVKVTYKSGQTKTITLSKYEKNMIFTDKTMFSVDSSGVIYASKKGTTTLKYYLDNQYTTITININ